MQVESGYAEVLEDEIAFPREGLVLRGVQTLTQGTQGESAAITLHGWGGTCTGPHRMFVSLGRLLAEQGIPTLRFDFAGRGKSDGESQLANLDGMIDDTCAAIDYLCAMGFSKISLIGICSGGNVAIGAGCLRPEVVGNLVCLSTLPFTPPTLSSGRRKAMGYFKEYLRKACSATTWNRLYHGDVSVNRVTRVIKKSLREDQDQRRLKDSKYDLMNQFKDFPNPVHFIYGGGDPEAPEACSHYQQFCKEHNLKGTYSYINESNHNFYSLRWTKELLGRIVTAVTNDLP